MDSITDITSTAINKLAQAMDDVIRKRLQELNIPIEELFADQERRFKKFIKESTNMSESYYYNDGTKKGLHIVTFEKEYPVSYCADKGVEVKYKIKYEE